MSEFFLLDHGQNVHWYTSRRGRILAEVVHITAGLEDLTGADQSAENVARYCATTDRDVSWHSTSDADSAFLMLPDRYTAWHCHGYNSVTCGHEISKRHTDWRRMPAVWTEQTLRRAASVQGPRARRNGVPFRHASKAELDRARATGAGPVGFVGHFELDPDRRHDPGEVGTLDTFPWTRYLRYCREAAYGEDDDMALSADDKKWLSANIGPKADVVTIVGASTSNPTWQVRSVLSDLHTRARALAAVTAANGAAIDALAKALADHDSGDIDPEAFAASVRAAAAAGAQDALEAMPLAAVLVREQG